MPAIALVVFLFAVWSSVFSVGKIVLEYTPPIFLTGFRMTLAGVLILLYLLITNRKALIVPKKQWFCIGLLAFFSIYLTNVLEFWGLQYLSAGKTCFLYSLSPFFAALFSYLHFKEKMTMRKWIGLTIGFSGFMPVIMMQTAGEGAFQAFGFMTWPALAIVFAALFSIYGWVLLRLVSKKEEMSPLATNGFSMLIGGLFALGHSYISEDWTHSLPFSTPASAEFIQGVLFMTLLYNIFCYNLYTWMLKRFTATFLSFVGLLSPIFASLSGWLFLGESFSVEIFVSTAVICLGLWVVYQAELKQGYIKPAPSIARKDAVTKI